MTIRLRPHHLLCMLTYIGKGYSEAFVDNYDAIISRLNAGEDIAIVDGPDDICIGRLGDPEAHCLEPRIAVRDQLAAHDISTILSLKIEGGARLVSDHVLLSQLRKAFSLSAIRSACSGCEWKQLCDTVAETGFTRVHLHACAKT